MMLPMNTALIRHPADRHAQPDAHTRTLRRKRAADRLALVARMIARLASLAPRRPAAAARPPAAPAE